jgi:uncharacterized membrane protein YphA (DoxX/SURF4 family)
MAIAGDHPVQENRNMEILFRTGRIALGTAFLAFGIQNCVWANLSGATLPIIPWLPAVPWLAYTAGLILIVGGAAIAIGCQLRAVGSILGSVFLLCFLFLQIPRTVVNPWDIGQRTLAFETLTMCACSWMLAGAVASRGRFEPRREDAVHALSIAGRTLFAISAVVFGISHFIVFSFVASLIPGWIPGGGAFWTVLTGVAFIAAGVSIAGLWLARWAAGLLGLMFFLWFVLLHVPRLFDPLKIHDPDEWSSAFIALAICGGSWIATRAVMRSPLLFALRREKLADGNQR